MLGRSEPRRWARSPLSFAVAAAFASGLALTGANGFSQTPAPSSPTASPPRDYALVTLCHNQLGALWAPRSAQDSVTGNEPPLLGFFDGKLIGMVFYLSDKHLYALLPRGGMWRFQGMVNAPVASVTVTPATLRPQRDRRAYELVVMVHHDPPVTVTCTQAGSSAPNNRREEDNTERGAPRKERPSEIIKKQSSH